MCFLRRKTIHFFLWDNYVMKVILFFYSTYGVKILNERQKITMKGPRDHAAGLWRINLLQTNPTCTISQSLYQPHSANNVYDLCNPGALVNYLHRSIFSCRKSSLVRAIKRGHLATWPESCQQTFEIDPCHSYGPHEPETPEHQVNKTKIDCTR
jgi:hypothetical protein